MVIITGIINGCLQAIAPYNYYKSTIIFILHLMEKKLRPVTPSSMSELKQVFLQQKQFISSHSPYAPGKTATYNV